jgi:hypothetical protein
MADRVQVEVVLANNDRVTLRVGDVFLKIDADQRRADVARAASARRPMISHAPCGPTSSQQRGKR